MLQFSKFFFSKSNLNRAVCTFCLIFKRIYTHTIWEIYIYTHIQTLAIAIQALKHLEPFQGMIVLSLVGRPELSQSVFQAGKKSISLSWSSQHSLLAQAQSCGKCSPVAFLFSFLRAVRKQTFMKENSVPKYLLCSLPNVTLNPRWDFCYNNVGLQ